MFGSIDGRDDDRPFEIHVDFDGRFSSFSRCTVFETSRCDLALEQALRIGLFRGKMFSFCFVFLAPTPRDRSPQFHHSRYKDRFKVRLHGHHDLTSCLSSSSSLLSAKPESFHASPATSQCWFMYSISAILQR